MWNSLNRELQRICTGIRVEELGRLSAGTGDRGSLRVKSWASLEKGQHSPLHSHRVIDKGQINSRSYHLRSMGKSLTGPTINRIIRHDSTS